MYLHCTQLDTCTLAYCVLTYGTLSHLFGPCAASVCSLITCILNPQFSRYFHKRPHPLSAKTEYDFSVTRQYQLSTKVDIESPSKFPISFGDSDHSSLRTLEIRLSPLLPVDATEDHVGGPDDGGHLPAVAQRARHARAAGAAGRRRGGIIDNQ